MRTVLAAALVLLAGAPAGAQTKAFVLLTTSCLAGPCEPTDVLEIDLETRQVLAITRVTNAPPGNDVTALTGDGRYLLWTRGLPTSVLSLFDTATRRTIATMPLATIGAPRIFTHPSKLRAFLVQTTDVLVIEPTRTQSFPAGCTNYTALGGGLSGDGTRLFVFCLTEVFPAPTGATRVFDSESGALLTTVGNTSHAQAANSTGTELYAVDFADLAPFRDQLRRYDVATGALLAVRDLPTFAALATVSVDPRTGHVYAALHGGSDPTHRGLFIYGATDLEPLQYIPTPDLPSISFSNSLPLALVTIQMREAGREWTRLMLVDTDHLAVITEADLPAGRVPAGVMVGRTPPQPQPIVATSDGNHVTLQWSPGTGTTPTTEYRLEAGYAKGTTFIRTTVPATATSLTVLNVPPGVYYARVRAANAAAVSAPSEEVKVFVPHR